MIEDELCSTNHQEQLRTIAEQGLQGKSFRSRTSFVPLKAPSTASGTPSPFHQLTFGTAPPITASDHIYVSGELSRNPVTRSTTFLESFQSPPVQPQLPPTMAMIDSSVADYTYEDSPMFRLKQEFMSGGEEVNSTFMLVTAFAAKTTLLASDIVDRGRERLCDTPRFHLHSSIFTELHKAIYKFQFYLERAAGLIRDRSRHFIIDPTDTFMTLLNGAYDLAQIHAAWLGVMTRLKLGLKFLDKYEEEYKGTTEDLPLSPISTLLEITAGLDRISNPNECMRFIYSKIPHHQSAISPEVQREFTNIGSWQSILPATQDLVETIYGKQSDSITGRPLDKGKAQELQRDLPPHMPNRPSRPSGVAEALFMGPNTPFKLSNQFFDVPAFRNDPGPANLTPGYGVEPNVLHGVGTPHPKVFNQPNPSSMAILPPTPRGSDHPRQQERQQSQRGSREGSRHLSRQHSRSRSRSGRGSCSSRAYQLPPPRGRGPPGGGGGGDNDDDSHGNHGNHRRDDSDPWRNPPTILIHLDHHQVAEEVAEEAVAEEAVEELGLVRMTA